MSSSIGSSSIGFRPYKPQQERISQIQHKQQHTQTPHSPLRLDSISSVSQDTSVQALIEIKTETIKEEFELQKEVRKQLITTQKKVIAEYAKNLHKIFLPFPNPKKNVAILDKKLKPLISHLRISEKGLNAVSLRVTQILNRQEISEPIVKKFDNLISTTAKYLSSLSPLDQLAKQIKKEAIPEFRFPHKRTKGNKTPTPPSKKEISKALQKYLSSKIRLLRMFQTMFQNSHATYMALKEYEALTPSRDSDTREIEAKIKTLGISEKA